MRVRLLTVLAVGVVSACGSTGPSVMEFVEVQPAQPKIGDVTTVRFRLIDSRGLPLAGAPVSFSLESPNTGITLSPTTTSSIRGSGFAETQLVANGRVNSVIVVATSGDKTLKSPPITFAGTVPSSRQLTFQCGPIAADGSGGRHAIGAFDGTRHLIAGSALDCSAHVADRNGDGIEGALVSFLTEAGAVGPSEVSISNLVGDATVLHKTSLPLPEDVTPVTFTWMPTRDDVTTGEYVAPLWMHPFNWNQNPAAMNTTVYSLQEPRRPDPIRLKPDSADRFLNNPRDNLVAMIAVTSGEEGFNDDNNDGLHQDTEPYDDLTEPFVDSNDDGTWNDGEKFIDSNGNRKWDGKNGKWDANTLIWRQERLLWTGYPAEEDTRLNVPGVAGHIPVFRSAGCANPTACPGGIVNLVCPSPSTGSCNQAGDPTNSYRPFRMVAFLTDPWFNSIARNGDSDKCQVEADDMQPIKVTGSTLSGFAFTYPSNNFFSFDISDKRDPNAKPIDQIPRRSPPIGFRANIVCSFTSAPKNPYEIRISVGTIEGSIE